MAFEQKKSVPAPSTVGGSEWLRSYPDPAPRTVHNPDDHSSVVEEDTILHNNLHLLEMPSAMEDWPELRDVQCHISEDMFLKPNRSGMQIVLYFLMACLLGREKVKRHFKGCWPPTSIALRQDFRSRSVDLIKKHGPLWQIDPGKIACIGAMLQRHAGLKMVEFLTSMSHAALVLAYQKFNPADTILPKSVQDPLLMSDIDLGELDERGSLCKMIIDTGKSKLSVQQQTLLHKVQVLNHMNKAYSTVTDSILEQHALMSNERAKYAQNGGFFQEQSDNNTKSQTHKSLKQILEVEAIADNIVGMKPYLDQLIGKDTSGAYGLSSSSILENYNATRAQEVTRKPVRHHVYSNGEGMVGEHASKTSLTAVLMPPNNLQVAPYSAHKSAAVSSGTKNRGRRYVDDSVSNDSASKIDSQPGHSSSPDVSLIEIMDSWRKDLKEFQSAAISVMKSSRAQNVSKMDELGVSGMDLNGACSFLKDNLSIFEELKTSLGKENSALDEQIASMRVSIMQHAKKHIDRQLSSTDFALDLGTNNS